MCDKILKEALEFMKFVKIPTMKELHTKYLKMSLEKHPDVLLKPQRTIRSYRTFIDSLETIL